VSTKLKKLPIGDFAAMVAGELAMKVLRGLVLCVVVINFVHVVIVSSRALTPWLLSPVCGVKFVCESFGCAVIGVGFSVCRSLEKHWRPGR
jgi:hypothetical protein